MASWRWTRRRRGDDLGSGLAQPTLTEAGTVTGSRPDDDFEHIATTVGVPWRGFEVRTTDESGNDAPVGEPGEVVVRGATVMRGYLDDPEATAAAIDADGWLHTGDLGTFDAGGYLRIVGRIKDMFIVGGFNAYPAEIENLLLGHPAVGRVAVVGMPDERLGEVGMAFVVLAPGAELKPEHVEQEIETWFGREFRGAIDVVLCRRKECGPELFASRGIPRAKRLTCVRYVLKADQ